MQTASVDLLTNASATGTGQQWPGGRGMFHATGTWGASTMGLEFQSYTGAWIAVKAMDGAGVRTAVTLTANDGFIFELPPCPIRATLTGGAPSAMYAGAIRVPY